MTETADKAQQRHEAARKALVYAAGLCVRAEQCESDIRLKLRLRELPEADINSIIAYLTQHNYLSDERYARAYVRTKSRLSGWGPWKVRRALAAKGIDNETINTAMQEADAQRYEDNALSAAQRKARQLDLRDRTDRMRLYRFLSSRGYEKGTISRVMTILSTDQENES